jgi:diguanylate cyclase (GGDEF)-like protein/PAS domain S-box-containing protein
MRPAAGFPTATRAPRTAIGLTPSQRLLAIERPRFETRCEQLVIGCLVAYALCSVAWYGARGGALGPLAAVAPIPPFIGAIAFAWRAAREHGLDRATRRFWALSAGASALVVVALLSAAVAQASPSALLPALGSIGFAVVSQAVLFVALLQLREAPAPGIERVKLSLDVATIGVAGLIVAWYLAGAFPAAQRPVVGLMHVAVAGDLALILTTSIVWQRAVSPTRRLALFLYTIALFVAFVSHVAEVLDIVRGVPQVNWAIQSAALVGVLVAAAAWLQRAGLDWQAGRRVVLVPRRIAGASLIPYIAILPAFGLVLEAATEVAAQPMQGLVVGAVVLTTLAFLRQAVATRETVRAQTAAAAREGEARFRALVQHSSDIITIVDPDGTIRYVSAAAAPVFGYDPDQLSGRQLLEFVHPDDVEGVQQFLAELAGTTTASDVPLPGSARKREWRWRHAGGAWMTVDNVGTNLLAEPTVQGLVLNTRDMTEQNAIKEQYMHQAFHDPLTDLANRSLFLYQVGHALARAHRHGEPVTVLFLDLDNFKTVNDSLGHAAGDRLLVEAARRLSTCVRDSDLIARLGGDEFAVLLEDASFDVDVMQIADRIAEVVQRPFLLGGKEVFISASIGIARTAGRETSDELVRNADVAMYVAKTRGKGQHVVFEPAMHTAALERLVVEADLRRAIERGEFVLQFQPIVSLDTGEVYGAEALVRWNCADRGTVPPSMFIPIAEETGLIVPIGRWVLREACRVARQWMLDRAVSVRISVNLSGRQLLEASIVDDVRSALEESGLPSHLLVLELTETMLMQHDGVSMERLTGLKALGVSVAIDDFGTGYSSLSYLQRYPIDILKIDKAFVDAMLTGEDGPVLAKAIVALGETLRLYTVAEGIETDAQRGQLLQLGCQLGQGYLFAPPLAADDFVRLMLTRGVKRLRPPSPPSRVRAHAA